MKVIVITGSSSGIGKTLAIHFANKGYTVYGLSRSNSEGVPFTHIATDVTNEENVNLSIQKILNQTGKIDILINNAGIGMLGAIEDANKEDLDKLFGVNFYGSIYTIKAVLPHMRKQQKGSILNVSSIASNSGLPFRGYYSASKSALDRVVEALRLENLNTGVQITTLNLGDVKTNIAESRLKSNVSTFYKSKYNQTIQSIDEEVQNGTPPEKLIPTLEKLIHKKRLKPHYYIGKPLQRFSVILKGILPQAWFEKLMINYSKLN